MIIDNFNVVGIVLPPAKTKTKLIIDSHTKLTLPIAFQAFQAITRGALQILQGLGGT
jgi:hypothetical protein